MVLNPSLFLRSSTTLEKKKKPENKQANKQTNKQKTAPHPPPRDWLELMPFWWAPRDFSSFTAFLTPRHLCTPKAGCPDIFRFGLHEKVNIFLSPVSACSFEALSHISQSNSKGLHCRKWILKVQNVSIAINSSKLHHLGSRGRGKGRKKNKVKKNEPQKRKQRRLRAKFFFSFVWTPRLLS